MIVTCTGIFGSTVVLLYWYHAWIRFNQTVQPTLLTPLSAPVPPAASDLYAREYIASQPCLGLPELDAWVRSVQQGR